MADYSSDELRRTAIPRWVETGDVGTWTREWLIEFVSAPSEARLAELSLSGDGIYVTYALKESILRITTTTAKNPLSDDVFVVAPARMLHKIDARVERIKTIQGQPREFWRSWLSGRWG